MLHMTNGIDARLGGARPLGESRWRWNEANGVLAAD